MDMTWGVLYKSFPFTNGEKGRACLNRKKTRSCGRSFRALLFNRIEQVKPRSLLAVGVCFTFTDEKIG